MAVLGRSEEQEHHSASTFEAVSTEEQPSLAISLSASSSRVVRPLVSAPTPSASSSTDNTERNPAGPSPKRKRTLPFPRTLRRSSRDLNTSSTSDLPATTSANTIPTANRFARSLSSLSTTSRPSSFLAITPARTRTTSSTSPTPPTGSRRSKSGIKMMKALSYIRPSSKKEAGEPILSAPPTPSTPTRPRSQSAPLLRTLSLPRQSLDDQDPHSPFVTALSSPVSESPPRVDTPVQLRLNLFDFLLPREVRLRIMSMVVQSCVEEHEKEVQEGLWRGDKARERWVGEIKGRRELIRISRVSRTWLSLALDGQHWRNIPTSLLGADILRTPSLLRLVGSAGTFVHDLDLKGMQALQGETLVEIAELAASAEFGMTNITSLNLTGCRAITTASLGYLLSHSPQLREVNLFALASVEAATLEVLGSTAEQLRSLNVSRCAALDAAALLRLPTGLETLRASKLGNLTDTLFISVMFRYPALLHLDISHNEHITDFAFAALSCPLGAPLPLPSSNFPPRDPPPSQKYQYPLRHLNLSSLPNITDLALRHLAHCLPSLTHLQLAHLDTSFHPPGLLHFLSTVPLLTHLDLEHNLQVDDTVLDHFPLGLQEVNLSSCIGISTGAWPSLLERCTSLRALHADGTTIGEDAARSFVASRWAAGVEGAFISVLDNRFLTRQLQKEVQGMSRPRTGQRGYWTTPLAYDDGPDDGGLLGGRKGALEECDETRVVVRSFYGNLEVDLADARRKIRSGVGRDKRRGRRSGSTGDGERGRSCIIS
ncbi:hypothetical protein BCR35DRAFT_328604 [Leucosporidium creatinivorum]|uniref:F-box domain-containing protein n=1 Tax=Leucosporidium creatinivorum TaxID=106004 RepID=A0A1Y2G1Q7_9BASI|nr:hypothetical protein BCR35DRAFT_328604 [Leucosporidium creatinivorum]